MSEIQVQLIALGETDQVFLEYLELGLRSVWGLSCRPFIRLDEPVFAHHPDRGQYNAKTILDYLLRKFSNPRVRLVAITDADLFIPILTYVYGLSQIQGRGAVISLHRLRPQYYDQPNQSAILRDRLEKTVLHELGHLFGLTHCRNRRCVMLASSRIEDTDSKQTNFCPACRSAFEWLLSRSRR